MAAGENRKTNAIPYAEAPWVQGQPTPYYNESHQRLRSAMNAWMKEKVLPFSSEWDEAASNPDELYREAAAAGVLMPSAFGAKIPDEWGSRYPIIGSITTAEWDGFHDLIVHDEFGRVGGIGLENGLLGGLTLCVPAIHKYASDRLKATVLNEVFSGHARISLAITEPGAGSDVKGVESGAQLSCDGNSLVLNGQKKWITGGLYAKYFLTLIREEGSNGFTLLVVPRVRGLSTKHIRTSGSATAGTAFVDFDDVHVPLDMVVGERGQGLRYIMSNFNHERLFISMQAVRCARVCLEDSITYALNRTTFGQRLIDQPIIRTKIANMGRETEALHSWLENLIFQIKNLPTQQADYLLAGTTAQLKAHAGIVLEKVVREAIQVMGGVGLTRGGRGERVERIWRDAKAITVPGGSEEVLLDFSTRWALKVYENKARAQL